MNRKILSILVIVSLLIVISSCGKWLENEFHPLPEYRYPSYQKGDTFLYKSIVTEDIDTFVVSDFKFDTLFNGGVLFEVSAAIFAEVVADTLGEEFFYISNEPNGSEFIWDSAYVYFVNTTETMDTTIQGFDYNYLLRATAFRQDTTSKKLHRIYFDWNYGLVKYVHNSLDSYELFSRPD